MAISMNNKSDNRCINPNETLGIDEACLSIVNKQNASLEVFSYVNECGACNGLPFANLLPNSNTSLVIPTRYEMHMYYTNDKNDQWCHGAYKFVEHGHYGWNLSDQGCSSYYIIQEPPNPYLPIMAASLCFIAIATFYGACSMISYIIKSIRQRRINENSDMEDLQEQEQEHSSSTLIISSRSNMRIKSIDTFRGITILLMIFVNNGGGKYIFFNHSPWYGLTVADLVLPWFAWIMGITLVVSLRTQLRVSISRPRIVVRALKRSLILVCLGLVINSNMNTTLYNLRFTGVLQLLGIAYFICAAIEATFMKVQRNYQYGRFIFLEFILDHWPQSLIIIALVTMHTLITFLLRVPGCPTGYLGPGGYHLRGQYTNCTGGAAGYIDRLIFGSHVYNKTHNPIYGTTLPHDPEGLMNTLSAVLIVAFGVQAGRILLCYYLHVHSKILRWLLWAVLTGITAGFLCNWEKEGGILPISKNMMTISFVLTTSCFAFILFAALFYLIDHKRIWNGAPFVYAGTNPILLYLGHYLTMGHFPWAWKILVPAHNSLLYMNLWTTVLWGLIAYVLYQKDIIVAV